MRTVRPPKKSETLEVRLSHADKADFMARCRREGRSASEAVRALIAIRASGPVPLPRRSPAGLVPALAAALAGLVIGAAAAPSVAQTAGDPSSFARLDRDGDGVLTPAEYAGR